MGAGHKILSLVEELIAVDSCWKKENSVFFSTVAFDGLPMFQQAVLCPCRLNDLQNRVHEIGEGEEVALGRRVEDEGIEMGLIKTHHMHA